jgi:hypothetical protein
MLHISTGNPRFHVVSLQTQGDLAGFGHDNHGDIGAVGRPRDHKLAP